VTVHANAGAGATGALDSATDVKGHVTFTTGSGAWKAGEQLRVNFNAPYSSSPIVLLVPQNAEASKAQRDREVTVVSSGRFFSVGFENADTAQRTYRWNYLVVE
jgi:hypothetical protein